MSSQLQQSLRDIVPGFSADFPNEVITCANSLYQVSLGKSPILPNKAEIARSHVCAYLAVEKYAEQFKLPFPDIGRIPLQPKLVDKLVVDFRDNLLNQIRSPSSSPRKPKLLVKEIVSSAKLNISESSPPSTVSTPVKSKFQDGSARIENSPRISSPLKRLQALRNDDLTPPRKRGRPSLKDSESPFNPSKESILVPSSPQLNSYYSKKHVSIPEMVAFANAFFIPSTYSSRMLESFLLHKHKFGKKSEWLLACGLVHAAYTRINQRLLHRTMGARLDFIHQLFQYQKGGLMKTNMLQWCEVVEEWIRKEPWISQIEEKYMFCSQSKNHATTEKERLARIGHEWPLLEKMGLMIHGDVQYDSESQNIYYATWSAEIMSRISPPL